MIEIDTSKMESKIKNNIQPPYIVKSPRDDFYMCVYEDKNKYKLVSLQNGYIQDYYFTLETLLDEGYEIYSATLNVTEKLA